MNLLKEQNKVQIDLCRNCVNAFNCSLKINHFDVVSQCEEHDSWESVELPEEIEAETHILPKTYQGLCSNCEHFNNCTLKEEQTIVLSCEQYS